MQYNNRPTRRSPHSENSQAPRASAQPQNPGNRSYPNSGPISDASQNIRRTDHSQAYSRRQAEYQRQRAYEAEMARRREAEKRRRKARKQHSIRVFVGRMIVFLIILAALAIIGSIAFWIHFNKSDPETPPSSVRYSFGGSDGGSLPADLAYRNEILYVDFHDVADYLGMTVIGDAVSMRYVIPSEGSAAAGSAGDGHEESVVFLAGSDLATVNGQSIRLSGEAVLSGDHYLVPADFLAEYMRGVAVTVSANTVSIARIFTDETADPLSFTLKDASAADPIEENDHIGEIDPNAPQTPSGTTPTDPDIRVTFQSDLSAYEKYMNPAERDAYLILVNSESTIDETYLPDDLIEIADTRQDGRAKQKMREYAARALEAMFIEMRACGYTDVSVTSAYRSYSYQNQLFNTYTAQEMQKNPSLSLAEAQAITATYSARPGTSEHQTGLCCDMHNLPSASTAFAKKEAYVWLRDNCWKFGFILRFPEGKEDITQISFEPWHYRYVGRYHAKAIYDTGMCLEEYLQSLNA